MLFSLHAVDEFILQAINLSFHNLYTDMAALLVSYLGVAYFWIIVIILLYLFGKSKGKFVAKVMLIVLVAVFIVTFIAKELVMRPRPYTQLANLVVIDLQHDYSFPSGHTSIATAMSYVLSKEYDKYFLMVIPFIVAFIRIYMGVHYPSDVLGGFLLGIVIACLLDYCIHFSRNKWLREKF